MESTNKPYFFPEAQPSAPPLGTTERPRELAPSRVALHLALLVVTALTTTLTGAAMSTQSSSDSSLVGIIFGPVLAIFDGSSLEPLTNGLLFTFTLLTILAAHELGHYFACRYYGIRATLPFFIPAPPVVTLFGTLGAVIKIKEPISTRRALFDIGIAGPLAGFVFALPASVLGLYFAKASVPVWGEGLQFLDPLLFKIIMKAFGLPLWMEWNPVYWAAWGTLLVTALNLFPVGQLDGGHVVYAVAGPRVHKIVSRVTCALVAALAIVSIVFYSSPVWLLWTVVLIFLLRVGHPPVVVDEPLGRARTILAIVAALVFLLCFMPFPITLS
ncbi:MAG TPA: site-2 protease family protein [Blastocatellia bacterium]|nr:site-2 protease family protein [Blastocatellia bacterium]